MVIFLKPDITLESVQKPFALGGVLMCRVAMMPYLTISLPQESQSTCSQIHRRQPNDTWNVRRQYQNNRHR